MALWKAIIIAGKTDVFVGQVIHILNTRGMDYTLCEDIYTATGQLTKYKDVPLLVIGSIHRLVPQDNRFLSLLMRLDGLCCCCVLDDVIPWGMSTVIQMAIRHNMFLVYRPEDIQIVIDGLASRFPQEKKTYCSDDGGLKECITTAEEIDALLRGYTDD